MFCKSLPKAVIFKSLAPKGDTAETFANCQVPFRRQRLVIFEPDFSAAARDVVSLVEPGDVVLTIGAGSVTMVAAEILDELRAS